MTETTNFKLKKPDLTDPINVNDFNDNFDTIDEELAKGGNKYFDLNLTAYNVDYGAESQMLDVTEAVPAEIIEALANGTVAQIVRLTFSSGATTVNMVLPDRYKTAEGYYRYFGTSGNLSQTSYTTLFLQPSYDETAGAWKLYLQCYANQLKAYVKTVNGVEPDVNGNVEIEEPYVKHIANVKAGQVITQTLTMSDGSQVVDTINLDENDYPVSGTFNGNAWTQTWEGFDDAEV